MQGEPERERKPNRLIHEKSPYLLQHAYNPVDWYPWSEEAFEKAKAQDKPVFVSIGYSSCHWCHVMEKESFDDNEVAKLVNEAFVCIKVDREERPDLDSAYMAVCQMMGRSCGWPLNIIMTPDKNPFFAASYIPKNSRFGLVGMVDLIPQIEEIWKTRRSDLENLGNDIKRRIEIFEKRTLGDDLGKDVLDDAYEKLSLNFDEQNGGFGRAPKFPTPHNLLFLLRYWSRTKEKNALAMAEKTLRAMHTGGIFDQVGFGFHRYSTDAEWLVPHFEKMLYDQALLALAYTEAFQATGAGKFKVTAKEALRYVLRDMASPEGGFYAAEDADSEGEEGKFYLWTEEEIRKTLPPEDADLAVKLFGVKAAGNYAEAGRKRNGENILHFAKPLEQVASESQLTVDELILRLGRICNLLFKAREKRVRPAKDDKILVDWTGLMIAALAKASSVFRESRYLQAAVKAAGFVLEEMRDENGTLYHRYAKGERAIEGFLDDYAFFVWGLVEIYEACFGEAYLRAAVELTETMVLRFWDEKDGGFYFTAKGAENAVPRRKEVYDGALPSGNSVALLNLLRLALLTGDAKYRELASQTIRVFSEDVKRAPAAHTFMLIGVDFAVGPAYNVILVGDPKEDSMQSMLSALKKGYLPNRVVSLRLPEKAGLGYEKIEGKATAYVCRDQTCMPPTNNTEKMLEYLGRS
ncbi:thioredoxin domain-containing protein [Candidatus Bathyarchaeota archaeon]|nr:thioredoxin domain-containing protein [Candidatus Bathyarchaeota archaeon]